MRIHLCKPGGQKEGPYTLKRVNRDLAAGKYTASDYWAWHAGLPEWVPLHSVPGIVEKPQDSAPTTPAPPDSGKEAAAPPDSGKEVPAPDVVPPAATSETGTANAAEIALESEKIPSGMPFAALEHIFILTSGDGPAASHSPICGVMLQTIAGEDLETIRRQVPRDVIGHCQLLEGLKGQSSTQGAVWRKMASLRPQLLQQAREGSYRICIRTFRIDNGDVVSVFLFYNKEKM